MIGLALHLFAIFAVAAFATSVLAGGLSRLSRARSFEPRARVTLALVALGAPLVVGLLVVVGIAMPHQWWGALDHCLDHPGHLHLCPVHGAPLPHGMVLGFAAGALTWMLLRLADALVRGWTGTRALRRVVGASRSHGDVRVVAGELPLAFTAGLLRPAVVVSEGVLEAAPRWRAVVEHERAHVARRDPLTRWIAGALASFHLPGLAAHLLDDLRDAQELAADDDAALAIGSRVQVAEALVDWLRWTRETPAAALGFHDGPLGERIRRLLHTPTEHAGPSPRAVALGAMLSALLVSLVTPSLHHVVETAFGHLLH